MNYRERGLAALRHQQPDTVPYDIRFTMPARIRMADYYGDPDFESKLGNCFAWLEPYAPGGQFEEVEPEPMSSVCCGIGTSIRISVWSATGW